MGVNLPNPTGFVLVPLKLALRFLKIKKARHVVSGFRFVGYTGFEPVTSTLSR